MAKAMQSVNNGGSAVHKLWCSGTLVFDTPGAFDELRELEAVARVAYNPDNEDLLARLVVRVPLPNVRTIYVTNVHAVAIELVAARAMRADAVVTVCVHHVPGNRTTVQVLRGDDDPVSRVFQPGEYTVTIGELAGWE